MKQRMKERVGMSSDTDCTGVRLGSFHCMSILVNYLLFPTTFSHENMKHFNEF